MLLVLGETALWYVKQQPIHDPLRRILLKSFSSELSKLGYAHHWLFKENVVIPIVEVEIVNVIWVLLLFMTFGMTLVWGVRKLVIFFEREVRGRLLGTRFQKSFYRFPFQPYSSNTFARMTNAPGQGKGATFIGLDPKKDPVVLEHRQRASHIQILGRTGSGKSKLLETLMVQDMLAGRGVVFLDGKGDEETRRRFCGMAKLAGRLNEVRIFDLFDQTRSWFYNPAIVPPKQDPLVTAEKLFSIFPCEEPYYRQLQETFFSLLFCALCKLGRTVCFQELYQLVKSPQMILQLQKGPQMVPEVEEVIAMWESLEPKASQTLTGLLNWLRKYSLIDQLNPCKEEGHVIHMEQIVEKGELLYVRLPAGYRQIYASAIGQLFIQDLQFAAGVRQVHGEGKASPFAIYVDEFSVFAHSSWVQAANKARSANLWWTIAHQSYADLETVSKEFAEAVWDNCRTKIILSQRNQKLCQRLADELGTLQEVERTERITQGAFLSRKATAEASSRLVDVYKLHPNHMKNLHHFGQGLMVAEGWKQGFVGLNFGELSVTETDVTPLFKKGESNETKNAA